MINDLDPIPSQTINQVQNNRQRLEHLSIPHFSLGKYQRMLSRKISRGTKKREIRDLENHRFCTGEKQNQAPEGSAALPHHGLSVHLSDTLPCTPFLCALGPWEVRSQSRHYSLVGSEEMIQKQRALLPVGKATEAKPMFGKLGGCLSWGELS